MDKLLSTVHLKHFPLEVIEKISSKCLFSALSLSRAHNFFIVRSRLLLLSFFVKCFKHDMPYTQVYVFLQPDILLSFFLFFFSHFHDYFSAISWCTGTGSINSLFFLIFVFFIIIVKNFSWLSLSQIFKYCCNFCWW